MADGLIADLEAALRAGDVLTAFDSGRTAIEAGRNEARLRYLVVLALARSGSPRDALAEYDRLKLGDEDDVDCASLRGRLLKDIAFEVQPPDRRLLHSAGTAYLEVFAKTDDFFPGINAASLLCMAGEQTTARGLAEKLLKLPALAKPADYFAAATVGEALSVLVRWREATAAFAFARTLLHNDFGALSSTFTQIQRLLEFLQPGEAVRDGLLALLKPPGVMHFDGADFSLSEKVAKSHLDEISAIIEQENVHFAFGTLATLGDIVIAEQVLARNAELNLILPYVADLDPQSLSHDEEEIGWRKKSLLLRATSVTLASDERDLRDQSQRDYSDMVAMGLARIRAEHLHSECLQLRLEANASAESRRRALAWNAAGGRSRAVTTGLEGRTVDDLQGRRGKSPPRPAGREIRALLFADFRKFTSLAEENIPVFWNEVMGGIAKLLAALGPDVHYRNTWGDALFIVLSDAATAAELALSIQEQLRQNSSVSDPPLDLRIGLHHGPVYRGWDPVRSELNFFGNQIAKAARTEPIAPVGGVIVTEQLAATLAVTANERFRCNYVGRIALPKGYGEYRMYRLHRRTEIHPLP